MIEVKDLNKIYNVAGQALKAVDNASFSVKKGEMVSIMGHSGSGKTTLLSLIGGLTKPDSGKVMIDEVDIWALDDNSLSEFRNRKISFIFQFSSLIPTLTAVENIMLPSAFGTFGSDIEGTARELLEIVGLKDKADALPAHLSGGQQRRVAIARAFINNPALILADEPTGDLDEEAERDILSLFHRMNEERGITFVIVTHNRDIAGSSERQLSMSGGILSQVV